MADDDWWDEAVDQFGLETTVLPVLTAVPLDADADPTTKVTRRRRRRAGLDWLIVAVLAIGSASLLRVFVVQQFAVDGRSMLGTLHSGDRVIVNKLSYVAHDPRHGDVVVLEDLKANVDVRDLIKRVIALPGETVEYRNCILLINGTVIAERYLDPRLVTAEHCGGPQSAVKVEPGHVFVMGDNRAESLDSRSPVVGQISFDNLIGRAVVVIWPKSDWRWL